MADEVLVIGAGPAGLVSAHYLEAAGIPYRIVEQSDHIGSTWSNLYPSLRLNTTKFFSNLPWHNMPWYYWIFPTARQYHNYLLDAVRRRHLNIHFGVTVRRVSPGVQGGWLVETSAGTDEYPAVILASGRFNNPYTPDIPGLDTFTGHRIHAVDFHGTEPFAGERVLIVGNGPSGVDIASVLPAVSKVPVLLAIRSGIQLAPRYPWGLPKHAWMVLTEPIPERYRERVREMIFSQPLRGAAELGLKPPAEDRPGTAAVARGRELVDAVRAGKVRIVPAPVRFGPNFAEMEDGTREEIDALILATGYRPALQYLDIPYDIDANGWPLRDLSNGPGYELLGYPGLYLVGVFYKGMGPLHNINAEAQIAVKEITAYLKRVWRGKGKHLTPLAGADPLSKQP